MPRSIRLDPELEERLVEVAKRDGVTVSAVARAAIKEYCEKKLDVTLYDVMKDYVGIVSSDFLCADRTGEAFTDLLVEKHQKTRGSKAG